jgi:hypothetical protein
MLLLVVTTEQAQTQTGIAGIWCAASVVPDGTSDGAIRDFFFRTQSERRIEGSAVTLNGVSNNQRVSFTGNLSGDEFVFSAVGMMPEPFHVVAHRVTRVTTVTGSVSDPALMQQLLKQSSVPGVSIAVIKDFKVSLAVAYGVTDAEAGTPMTTRTMFQAVSISKPVAAMVSLKAVQDKRFSLDQDVNTILKSWKLPVGEWTKSGPVYAPQADESYLRHGRWFRVSGLRSWGGAAHTAADPGWRPAVESPCRSAGTCTDVGI